MVDKIADVFQQYVDKVREMTLAPKCSFKQYYFGTRGNVNQVFLTVLFCDHATGLQFLKDVGLIPSKMQCNLCGRDMSWCVDAGKPDGFRWRCRKMVRGSKCSGSRSIRHGTLFQNSHLTFKEVLYLTYDILRREPAFQIQNEYCFNENTITDWAMFCRETMSVFLEGCSEKIGGPNKTVEIDESKFSRRIYHRVLPVEGQWMFGGIERESGRTFLVPVPERTADTLMNHIRAWIEPGTRVISDCWAGYRNVGSMGYTHRTINHPVSFVNPQTEDHTDTMETMWRAVKQIVWPYNRPERYEFRLAHYMFAARCKGMGVSQFNQFLHIVASIDWVTCTAPGSSGASAE
jgi:hypothetical protein